MIIEVNNLVKRYGEKVVIDHLNLNIKEGEIYGLLGPNGAGKSTTINCILSLLKFNSGNIKILGTPMSADNLKVKSQLGIVPQNVAVFDELTVYENIDFFCGLYIKDTAKRKQYVEEAINFVELNEYRKYYPKKLSGGLLRRLNIACGVAHKPKIIFLDEPTVAVDPQSRNHILEGIKKLNKNGATIIYTSHYMEEVEELCDRVGIMDNGRIIAEGTKSELKNMISNTNVLILESFQFNDDVISQMKRVDGVQSIILNDNTLKISYKKTKNILLNILEIVENNGINLNKIFNDEPTLNTVFLELTGKELRD